MGRHITVRLVGGLGNQLFCYFAGAALAGHLGVPLRLDTSRTRFGFTDHGIEIVRFSLPGEWLPEEQWIGPAPWTVSSRAIDKLLRELPALGRPWRIHQAPGQWGDPRLLDQPPGTQLRGYFQSWRIVAKAVEGGYPRRFGLSTSSPWLNRIRDRINQESPIGVHVRRGDYLKAESLLLGPEYYEPALEMLRDAGHNGPIWLFSDDLEAAQVAIGRFRATELIRCPEGAAPEMLALAALPARVIANSTFSWWSGWLGGEDSMTVAPPSWAPGIRTPDELLPPGWFTPSDGRPSG